MQISPSFLEFKQKFDAGIPQVVTQTIIADLETPVSAMLKLQNPSEPCFLLESVQGGETRGRYSIIGLKPDLLFRCRGEQSQINDKGTLTEADFVTQNGDSLSVLKKLVRDCRIDLPDNLPPMSAGLIGYMGYDCIRLSEKLPDNNPDNIGLPDAYFMRPQIMLIFDAVKGELNITTPIWKDSKFSDAESAYKNAVDLIEEIIAKLRTHLLAQAACEQAITPNFTSNTSQAEYEKMVEKAREHITAGDIFQVVPSQRFSAEFDLPHLAFYRSLRHLNPSPFLFYLNFADFSLVGSSPEILVRLRDDIVTIRPIAGTRKRGANKKEDLELEQDLLADPKEISEHLMLLDLGRNDVGRVAKIGSVKVTEQMTVERYSHVMHIVSNVEGEIDPKYDAIDALIAGFPAGTVSGAPKVRAMQIIDELEKERRSFYAGCVGYFSANGSMDTCITLRTALLKDGKIYAQAGGGVVVDSDGVAEYQESCNKAKAIMKAAEEAWKFVGV